MRKGVMWGCEEGGIDFQNIQLIIFVYEFCPKSCKITQKKRRRNLAKYN